MRVVHINTWDYYGGAAQGMFILHKELIRQGVDSLVLVQHQTIEDETIVRFCDDNEALYRQGIDTLPVQTYVKKNIGLISTAILSAPQLLKKIEELDPDIVHLHWVGGGILSIEDIGKIKRPMVWTLRDFWPFSGGCHHALECDSFMLECGKCPILRSNDEKDLSYEILKRKKRSFSSEKITAVGISKWISDKASQSTLLQDFDIRTIYNSIDTNLFTHLEQEKAKNSLGITSNKKTVSFGAHSLDDPHKGLELFLTALDIFNKDDIFVLLFGSVTPKVIEKISQEHHSFGYVENKELLRDIYAASDLFIAPSLLEPFGKTIGEAMACGTPVVAFASCGGGAELITHKEDGYLVENFSADALHRGIVWCLEHQLKQSAGLLCSQKMQSHFSPKISAEAYIRLYEDKQGLATWKSLAEFEEKSLREELEKSSAMKRLIEKFEAIHSSQLIVYGYGFMGQALHSLFRDKITAFVDVDVTKIDNRVVFHPTVLKEMSFDTIVISVLRYEEAIRTYLVNELGMDASKIVTVLEEEVAV